MGHAFTGEGPIEGSKDKKNICLAQDLIHMIAAGCPKVKSKDRMKDSCHAR